MAGRVGSFTVEQQIGQRIRALRSEKGVTLDQLARQVRLTKGQISKIENGLVSSPVSTLTRVASALGVDVGGLFTDAEPHELAVLVKKRDRKVIVGRGTKMGHIYQSLAFGLPFQKAFEPYLMLIEEKSINRAQNSFKHPGHEFLFMLEGAMEYRHRNKTYHLDPGDGLFFDASYEHGPGSISKRPVKFLSIISNPLFHR